MVEVKKYHLSATGLIPNSPHPLLHYKNVLPDNKPSDIHDLYTSNGWETQWIFRYGDTQRSHYHSATHECMTVLSGTATIRFGVADTSDDMEANTHGSDYESGGVELLAEAGDVFIIPAGVAHKTYDAKPEMPFQLLTPGDAHAVSAPDVKQALQETELSGFTMMGCYPMKHSVRWDYPIGGEDEGRYEKVWSVPKPEKDPVMGKAEEGICGQWVVKI